RPGGASPGRREGAHPPQRRHPLLRHRPAVLHQPALLPAGGARGHLRARGDQHRAPHQGRVPAGGGGRGERHLRLGGFAGPKDGDLLAVAPSASTAALVGLDAGQAPPAGLDGLIDFGILVVLCKLLLGILKGAFAIFGNWGIAIVAMTFLIKMLLLPLTYKQMVSAEQMKKLQPQMEQIRKKFADDKEKQQLEMMKMYQEAKVNPLAGCLPMLLQ